MDLGYNLFDFCGTVLKKSDVRTGQTLNFSPVLKQICVSLNEVDQVVFVFFNMEIKERDFKTSLFL